MPSRVTSSSLRLLAGAVLILAVVIIVYLHTTSPGDPKPLPDHAQPHPAATSSTAPEQAPPSSGSISSPQAQQHSAARSATFADTREGWQIDDRALPDFPLPTGVMIYEAVILEADSAIHPQPGERLQLPLPEGWTVQVTVGSAHTSPNGDYSWHGYVDGYGDDYPVVMTYGQRSVFATVTTPQGSYGLESVNGSGWVYKHPAAEELSLPGVEDHMDIPGTRPGEHTHHSQHTH